MADTAPSAAGPDHETQAELVEGLIDRDREVRRLMKDLTKNINDLKVVIANAEADIRNLKDKRDNYRLERQGIDGALSDLRYR